MRVGCRARACKVVPAKEAGKGALAQNEASKGDDRRRESFRQRTSLMVLYVLMSPTDNL